MGNQKWTIQRNWQHRAHKMKKNKTKTRHNMCWTLLYTTITNNANKTWTLLQTTGGQDEPSYKQPEVKTWTLLQTTGGQYMNPLTNNRRSRRTEHRTKLKLINILKQKMNFKSLKRHTILVELIFFNAKCNCFLDHLTLNHLLAIDLHSINGSIIITFLVTCIL